EPLSAPRPGIDGAHDPRGAEQRHADALTDVLDAYLGRGAGPGVGGGKPQVTLIAEAQELTGRGRFVHKLTERREDGSEPDASEYQDLFDSPWPFRLSWTGSVSRQVAQLLACDSDVTVVVVDANRVPLDVGRTERLVTKPIRNALIVRDEGCAMPGCGRPPGWCDAHHVIPWMNGGDTSLSNMVLLCRHHHRLVHKGGWQLQIGSDGHPWFIPPVSVDRRRRPLPAHNRQHTGSAGEAA
ncbi:MAG: DUF222 domain-containing protein, partial [Aldersonia sp.]|nr:DUF222 domain-containing protein [Aldersonia sp.]